MDPLAGSLLLEVGTRVLDRLLPPSPQSAKLDPAQTAQFEAWLQTAQTASVRAPSLTSYLQAEGLSNLDAVHVRRDELSSLLQQLPGMETLPAGWENRASLQTLSPHESVLLVDGQTFPLSAEAQPLAERWGQLRDLATQASFFPGTPLMQHAQTLDAARQVA